MTLSRKILLITLAFLTLTLTLALGVETAFSSVSYARSEEVQMQNLGQAFTGRIASLEAFALALATEVANDEAVQAAFAAGDRERLTALTLPAYEEIDRAFDVPQHQFHLPPATSFLRLHQLDRFGDDLSTFRNTVLAANAQQQPISGLEIGRGGVGVRGVAPVFYQGDHVGSVEFGLNVDETLLLDLKEQFGMDWQILLLEEPSSIATFSGAVSEEDGPLPSLLLQTSTLATPFFASAEHYEQALSGQSLLERDVIFADNNYGFYSLPLRDFSGNIIGVIELVNLRTPYVQQQVQRGLVFIGLLLGALVFAGFGVNSVINRIVQPIREVTQTAEAIADGDLSRSITYSSHDEIGVLAKAFNSMTKQLKQSIGLLEQRVAEKTRDLNLAAETGRQISQVNDLGTLLPQAVSTIRDDFGLYHVQIYLLDEETESLVLRAGTGEAGRQLLQANHSLPLHAASINSSAAQRQERVVVADTKDSAVFQPNPLLPQTRSEAAVPLLQRDQLLGTLNLQSAQPEAFDDDTLNALELLARQLAVAISNANLFSQRERAERVLSKRATELETVTEISTAITTILDTAVLLQTVVDKTKESFDLYHAHIYLLDKDENLLKLTAGAGDVGRQMVAEGRTIPAGKEQSLVARAARAKRGIIVNDVTQNPDFLPHPLLPDTKAEMAVPVMIADQVVGVLDVQANHVNAFTEQDAQIKTTLAAQVAVALQNTRQYQATQAALEKAETFRNLVENTGQGIGIASLDGVLSYANPALRQLLGLDLHALLPQQPLVNYYAPGDQEQLQTAVRTTLREQGQWQGEMDMTPSDDSTLIPTLQNYILLPDEDGSPAALAVVITDITERKMAEERLQKNQERLTESTNIAKLYYWEFDVATQQFTFSPEYFKALNIPVTDETDYTMSVTEYAEKYIPPEEAALVGERVEAALTTTEAEFSSEVEASNLTADGRYIPVMVRFKLVRDEDGRPMKLVGANQDITERKQAEEAQRMLAVQLEEQLRQVQALQRAMTREGWDNYRKETAQTDAANGYLFQGEKIKPLPKATAAAANGAALSPEQTPLTLYGQEIGVLEARNPDGRPLTTAQKETLNRLSTQVAEALERARLFEETELNRRQLDAQAHELAVINEVAQSVSQLLDPADLLETIFKQVQRTLIADAFIVATYDERSGMLTYPLVYDGGQRFKPPTGRPAADNPWLQVVQTGEPFLLNRSPEEVAQRQAELSESDQQRLGQPGKVSASLIFTPLFLGQKAVGALSVQSYAHAAYTERDLALLAGIANHVAVALENARLYTETQRRAEREAIVNAISQKIQSAPTVESAMQTAVSELGKALRIKRAVVELTTTAPLKEK